MNTVIVVGKPGWRIGVAGIVANKLAETYDRPAFVWGRESGGTIKGSCRSDGRVNIVALMGLVRDGIFIDRGGHEFSGGFSVGNDAIHVLESALVEAHATIAKKEKGTDAEVEDAILSLRDVNDEIFNAIDLLAPFGEGNPKPIFRFPNVILDRVESFGKGREHLRLALKDRSGARASAIGFFITPNDFPDVSVEHGSTVSLLATFERSYYRGKHELRLRIVGILP